MPKVNEISWRWTAAAAIAAALLGASFDALAQMVCEDTPEGRICKVPQPITLGVEVGSDTQRKLGLVTVNGGCSGTLLNRFWVLTARHCVTTNGLIPGPLLAAQRVTVTATWAPNQIGIASRVAEFAVNVAAPGSADIVLVYLGTADLGSVDSQRVFARVQSMSGNSVVLSGRLQMTDVVTQYGRGFSTYASGVFGGTTPAVQSGGAGTFRSARFSPSQITGTGYTLAMNASSQVGHGGDSGGPSVVTINNVGVGIAGVQSTCSASGYVPNAPTPAGAANPGWRWATGITACQYVSTEPFGTEIHNAIRETPGCRNGPRCAVPAILSAAPPAP